MNRKSSLARTLDLVYIALGAALIAVCAWISIPLTVPVTLQTFAVFFLVTLLGGKRGTASVIVYLLLGAAGVPVFAQFTSGIGIILGNTGGYMLGFIFIGLIAWAAERFLGREFIVQTAALLVGLVVCYGFGTAWFLYVYTRDNGAVALGTVLSWCVIPFIFPDLLKLVIAQTVARRVAPLIAAERSAYSA